MNYPYATLDNAMENDGRAAPTQVSQFLGCFKKNVILKRRKFKQTAFELIMPIYFSGASGLGCDAPTSWPAASLNASPWHTPAET